MAATRPKQGAAALTPSSTALVASCRFARTRSASGVLHTGGAASTLRRLTAGATAQVRARRPRATILDAPLPQMYNMHNLDPSHARP